MGHEGPWRSNARASKAVASGHVTRARIYAAAICGLSGLRACEGWLGFVSCAPSTSTCEFRRHRKSAAAWELPGGVARSSIATRRAETFGQSDFTARRARPPRSRRSWLKNHIVQQADLAHSNSHRQHRPPCDLVDLLHGGSGQKGVSWLWWLCMPTSLTLSLVPHPRPRPRPYPYPHPLELPS